MTALIGLVSRNKRRYGGYLVHVGIAFMFIGFAGQTYQKETDVTVDRGQQTTLGLYTIKYEGSRSYSDPQKEVTEVYLTVTSAVGGSFTLRPAKWAYRGHEEEPPRTIVSIKESIREDLYVILNGIDGESGLASIKIIVNPLVNWVWFGFAMLILGTVIAFLPERAYALAEKGADKAEGAAGAVATAVLLLSLALPGQASALTLAAAGDSATHMSSAGSSFPTPPRNELERDLRKSLVCMCGCGRQTLAECTCGFAAKERAFIANLIDQGKLREEIVKAFISRYPGESALVVPVDIGFNRLAWLIPVLALLGTAGGLSILARRWRENQRLADAAEQKKQASTADKNADPKADQKYLDRLDDELDDLN